MTSLDQEPWLYDIGDYVYKPKGSYWAGIVVGMYSTQQTPRGYAVQLPTEHHNGPVQIYPQAALARKGPND